VRRRRPAAETRAAIVAAAQIRLKESGPATLRLDDVADDVGISRQAVLHHFGSRDGLMRAVVEQAWTGLFGELTALAGSAETMDPAEFLDLVDDVARRQGNARLGAWLLLSGQGLPDEVFDRAAALPAAEPDARFAMLLVGAALFGDAVFGDRLRQVLGLPDSEADREAFRAWIAERIQPPKG